MPEYYDGDYYCAVCGEPWDAYGVRLALKGEISDMTKEEAERFMRDEGCPCCPPKCPKCNTTLKRIYPLGDTSQGVDFLACSKCEIAYHPKTLKPLAHIVGLSK